MYTHEPTCLNCGRVEESVSFLLPHGVDGFRVYGSTANCIYCNEQINHVHETYSTQDKTGLIHKTCFEKVKTKPAGNPHGIRAPVAAAQEMHSQLRMHQSPTQSQTRALRLQEQQTHAPYASTILAYDKSQARSHQHALRPQEQQTHAPYASTFLPYDKSPARSHQHALRLQLLQEHALAYQEQQMLSQKSTRPQRSLTDRY